MTELTVSKEVLKKLIIEERGKLHELCKVYLNGKWNDVAEDQIKINIFDKGNACKIFHCQLSNDDNSNNNDTDSVVIKFMSNVEILFFKPLNTRITTLIMSEKRISPKVFGMFAEGIIFEFVKGRTYNYRDDYNDRTVTLLARKVAQIHSTNVPIEKNGKDSYFSVVFDSFFLPTEHNDPLGMTKMLESYKTGKLRNIIESREMNQLMITNLVEEFRWMQSLFENITSPLVFSHNDFNHRNILIRSIGTHVNSINDILIIDFDNSCYNYRGLDIGGYFSFWRIESDFGYGPYPTDDQMKIFIDAYICEMVKLNGSCYSLLEINSRQNIIKEAKCFTLFNYLVGAYFCLLMVHSERPPITQFLVILSIYHFMFHDLPFINLLNLK